MTSAPLADSQAYYRRLSPDTFLPTRHTQGAWQEDEQHMAPVTGLLVHALEAHQPREGMQLARVGMEILGMIPAAESTVRTRTVRPGRTIELIEATLTIHGRDVVRATAWRLSTQDTSAAAGSELAPMPDPLTVQPWPATDVWGGGYIASVQFRAVEPPRPGRARAWLRTEHDLIEGETSSELARYLGLVDTANGIAVRGLPREWAFPNTDLTIHLHRSPRGRWVGLDTTVSWGPTGLGVTSTVLHDTSGPVGHALQVLTVRPITPTGTV